MTSNQELPGPCPAGYVPPWIYNQHEWWIEADGRQVRLERLELPELLSALDLIERRAHDDWEHEIEVFLAFLRQQKFVGAQSELAELWHILSLGARGWLEEKKLFSALTARANSFIVAS